MLKEIARVTAVDAGHAWLEAQRKTVCGSCQASKGCGISLVDRLFSPGKTAIRISNTAGLAAGDLVEIGLDGKALVRGSALVYLVPVILMLFFAVLAGQAGQPDGVVAAWAMAGLAGGFYMVYVYSRRLLSNSKYQAVLIRKIEN